MGEVHAVTGAFGYSGGYMARALLDAGHTVCTLTRSPDRPHPLQAHVDARPLAWEDPAGLRRALADVRVLYNTYWVRFTKAGFSHAQAVRNSRALFDAARATGVERVVHVSITNPSVDSRYSYFRGKAEVEDALMGTGLSHAILRPAVLFGGPDILLNNIAWMLRRFPLFGVVRGGAYRLQPIHVRDLAALAVEAGARREDVTLDAIGPETWTYRDLVKAIGRAVGHPRRLVPVPKWLALTVTRILGWFVRDVVLTGDEIDALADDLLATDSPSSAPTRLSTWLDAHGDVLGLRYANELTRRRLRDRAYVS